MKRKRYLKSITKNKDLQKMATETRDNISLADFMKYLDSKEIIYRPEQTVKPWKKILKIQQKIARLKAIEEQKRKEKEEEIKRYCKIYDELYSVTSPNNRYRLPEPKSEVKTIPWECIEFSNYHVFIYNYEKDSRNEEKIVVLKNLSPLIVDSKISRKSFNIIKSYIGMKLPVIRAVVRKGKVSRLLSPLDLTQALRVLERKSLEFETNDDSEIKRGNNSKSYVPGIPRTNQEEVLNRLRRQKSHYLDYLAKVQHKDKLVVPCMEMLSHTLSDSEEDAFIFTLKDNKASTLRIVVENVNAARASIVFIINSYNYDKALIHIFNFIQSKEINKRQKLHINHFNFRLYGIREYYMVYHTNFHEWKINL